MRMAKWIAKRMIKGKVKWNDVHVKIRPMVRKWLEEFERTDLITEED